VIDIHPRQTRNEPPLRALDQVSRFGLSHVQIMVICVR